MKNNQTTIIKSLAVSFLALGLASLTPLQAVPTPIVEMDVPALCDPLIIPDLVDEIGLPVMMGGTFPMDEALMSVDLGAGPAACAATNGIGIDALVRIVNLTTTDWKQVWYVADQGTTISNIDGSITNFSGVAAFQIDTVGVNTPLIFESILADGIWQAGEAWDFVIQDYVNAGGLTPDLFNSVGLNSFTDPLSSGSIIAYVPEPSRAMLLMLGMTGMVLKRRRS